MSDTTDNNETTTGTTAVLDVDSTPTNPETQLDKDVDAAVDQPDKITELTEALIEEGTKHPRKLASALREMGSKVGAKFSSEDTPPEGGTGGETQTPGPNPSDPEEARKGLIFWIAYKGKAFWNRMVQFAKSSWLKKISFAVFMFVLLGGAGIAMAAFINFLFSVNVILGWSVVGALAVELVLTATAWLGDSYVNTMRSHPEMAAVVA